MHRGADCFGPSGNTATLDGWIDSTTHLVRKDTLGTAIPFARATHIEVTAALRQQN
jgi:hypothetical protein